MYVNPFGFKNQAHESWLKMKAPNEPQNHVDSFHSPGEVESVCDISMYLFDLFSTRGRLLPPLLQSMDLVPTTDQGSRQT